MKPLFSDVDIFAIWASTSLNLHRLVSQLCSDWMDNLDAGDIDQYLPSKQFPAGAHVKPLREVS